DQPGGVRASEGDAPVVVHTGQRRPRVALVGRPRRTYRARDDDRFPTRLGLAGVSRITEPEDGADVGLLRRARPGLAAVARGRGLMERRRCWIEVSPADHPVLRVAERDAECAGA